MMVCKHPCLWQTLSVSGLSAYSKENRMARRPFLTKRQWREGCCPVLILSQLPAHYARGWQNQHPRWGRWRAFHGAPHQETVWSDWHKAASRLGMKTPTAPSLSWRCSLSQMFDRAPELSGHKPGSQTWRVNPANSSVGGGRCFWWRVWDPHGGPLWIPLFPPTSSSPWSVQTAHLRLWRV